MGNEIQELQKTLRQIREAAKIPLDLKSPKLEDTKKYFFDFFSNKKTELETLLLSIKENVDNTDLIQEANLKISTINNLLESKDHLTQTLIKNSCNTLALERALPYYDPQESSEPNKPQSENPEPQKRKLEEQKEDGLDIIDPKQHEFSVYTYDKKQNQYVEKSINNTNIEEFANDNRTIERTANYYLAPKGTASQSLREFLQQKPAPSDEQVQKWAKEQGFPIYKMSKSELYHFIKGENFEFKNEMALNDPARSKEIIKNFIQEPYNSRSGESIVEPAEKKQALAKDPVMPKAVGNPPTIEGQ